MSTLALFDLLPTSEIRCYPLVMVCGIIDRVEYIQHSSVHSSIVAMSLLLENLYTYSHSSHSLFSFCVFPVLTCWKIKYSKMYKWKGAALQSAWNKRLCKIHITKQISTRLWKTAIKIHSYRTWFRHYFWLVTLYWLVNGVVWACLKHTHTQTVRTILLHTEN